jgi:transposase
VAQALDAAEGTVFRIKRRFTEDGLDGALKAQAHRYRKVDDRARPT